MSIFLHYYAFYKDFLEYENSCVTLYVAYSERDRIVSFLFRPITACIRIRVRMVILYLSQGVIYTRFSGRHKCQYVEKSQRKTTVQPGKLHRNNEDLIATIDECIIACSDLTGSSSDLEHAMIYRTREAKHTGDETVQCPVSDSHSSLCGFSLRLDTPQ